MSDRLKTAMGMNPKSLTIQNFDLNIQESFNKQTASDLERFVFRQERREIVQTVEHVNHVGFAYKSQPTGRPDLFRDRRH